MSELGPRTRRGFLALTGSAVLAGCNGFGFGNDEESKLLDGGALGEITTGERPPAGEWPPVRISRSHLEATERRARDLLSSVPNPLTAEHVPNEAIRNALSRRREHAAEFLESTPDDSSRFERMVWFRRARGYAAEVNGAWRVIEEDRTRDDIVAPVSGVRDDIDAFRDSWRYIGDAPVPAAVVHDAIEDLTETANRYAELDTPNREYESGSALALGELASRLEEARATIADVEHVYDHHTASVEQSTDYESRFRTAAASLAELIDERHSDLPNEFNVEASDLAGRDVSDSPAAELDHWFHDALRSKRRVQDDRSEGLVAGAVLEARRALGELRAFESVRDRIADGDDLRVESIDDIADRRANAVRAIESVRSTNESALHMAAARTVAQELQYVDERLRDDAHGDEVKLRYVDDTAAEYVWVAARAAAISPSADRVVEELRSN